MNCVKRAVIMAAGMGSRLRPLTYKIPKPLIEVNGNKMIETIINGLRSNGIEEIYVVVGYMKNCFLYLTEIYPGIELIENPYYDTCNNISSLYVARDHLEDVIVVDGDQVVCNKQVLSADFERSGYNAVWTDGFTTEWLMTEENGIVTSCSRTGGSSGWQLYGISRWSAEDGRKLKRHLEIEFDEKQNRQIYWDDVAMFCYPEEYCLGVRAMNYGDVIEIDSLDELAEIDKNYKYILTGDNK